MGKYIVNQTAKTTYNKETGEIKEEMYQTSVKKIDVEPFFFTYSKEIMALYSKNIFNATTLVLWKLLEYAEWNTGKVYMTPERIDEITNVCKISKRSYYRALEELREIGIISGKKNTLSIAENMFWKGDRESRKKLMQARGFQAIYTPIYDESEE